MTKFQTQAHWFDSAWPSLDGQIILVPIDVGTPTETLEGLGETIASNKDKTFLLLTDSLDSFAKKTPSAWWRMPPEGGIPPNAWVGVSTNTQKETFEGMRRLIKIRATKLFVHLKRGHDPFVDLKPGLISWRCSNCGRKDGFNRINRPTKCASGNICHQSELGPQIHWVIDMSDNSSTKLKSLCADLGVAFWGSNNKEIPHDEDTHRANL